MKIFPVIVSVVAAVLARPTSAAEAKPVADPKIEAWIAGFQRYAAQPNNRSEASDRTAPAPSDQLQFRDVLRALPEPESWPQLQRALTTAAAALPADQTRDRLRLQAGGWLIAYLLGDQKKLAAELAALVPATPESENAKRESWALKNLHASLTTPAAQDSLEIQTKDFEERVKALEPVDVAEVKRILGSEENFSRLKRLAEALPAEQKRAEQIAEEYERTKDEATAQAKWEALEKEFSAKHGADQKALGAALENPVIARYFTSLLPEGANPENDGATLSVPDRLTEIGAERATALLRRAFRAGASLSLNGKPTADTRTLVRAILLAEMETLKVPSWKLAQGDDSTEIFLALRRRFPATDPQDYDYREAHGYFVAGLIASGRTADAIAAATELPAGPPGAEPFRLPCEAVDRLAQKHPAQLWDFFHAWFARHPTADYWKQFNLLSVQLDRKAELTALLKTMATDGALAGLSRLKVQELQADVELATDDISAAVTRLRALVLTPASAPDERSVQLDIAKKLLELADLQADPAAYASLLAATEATVEKDWAERAGGSLDFASSIVTTLNGLGHFSDSARLGRIALERFAELEKKAEAETDPEKHPSRPSSYLRRNLLAEQLNAEVELAHWPAAAALLQENPGWETADVAGLLRQTTGLRKPLGFYAARVAQNQGDRGLARRILEAQLVANPAVDAVYENYLQLAGQEAMPLLEKLAATDRYEERPLIWKARLQLDAGATEEAVKTLQQAITIDPSDGEQGRGDRMRVYALMGEAMKVKGDPAKAAFFEGVVRAIRLSEQADRWHEAGAYARSIALYRQALGFFQDAYCIQSRLAIRLAHEGKMDEAVEHYRRAFELMPDSFGRVESHCFGCEHVFEGEKSQGVAEEVFARLLKARPDQPQLHYLSGYLRDQQDRSAEAADFYRRAVQLDPLYLNAWSHISGLAEKLHFTPRETDDLLLKLVELDPAQRHGSPNLRRVSDLSRLWRTMKEASRVLAELPAPAPLWELKASAAHLAKTQGGNVAPAFGGEAVSAVSIVLEHDFVRALQSYLEALNEKPAAH